MSVEGVLDYMTVFSSYFVLRLLSLRVFVLSHEVRITGVRGVGVLPHPTVFFIGLLFEQSENSQLSRAASACMGMHSSRFHWVP